jgi:hypothetical protein
MGYNNMPQTYEPLATTTLGTAAASITFSSISAAYTDLRLVLTGTVSTAGSPYMRYNSDTGSNYSFTFIRGSGTAAGSSRASNFTEQYLFYYGYMDTTVPTFATADIFSYAGSTFKTSLITASSDFNGSGAVERIVGLWRSTAAINRIDLYPTTGNFSIGTTATLYGIKAA